MVRFGGGRRTRRLVAVLFGLLVLVAACSGDDGDGSPADGSADGANDDSRPEDVAIGGQDLEAPALVLSEVAVAGDALFPCVGDPGSGTIRVVYVQQLPSEVVGPLAEAFRAAVGDYQLRCGGVAAGALDVAVGYAEGATESDVCALPQLAGAAIVVVDSADDATAACLGSSSRLVWHEGGASDPASTAGTHAPPAVRAANAVVAALAENVVGDRPVLILDDGTSRSRQAVESVLSKLEEASIEASSTLGCNGATPGPEFDGAFVITLAPATCVAELAAATGSLGAEVRWLVIEDDLSLAPLEGVVFDGAAFDTALAYEFAPTVTAGLPRDRAPVPRDRACVAFLDELTGHQTEFPGAAFSAHARLCSTIAGVLASLHAAGDAPTPESVLDAIPDVAPGIVLSQGQRRGASGDPWLAPPLITTVEWNADCECWTYVRGPDLVPVD